MTDFTFYTSQNASPDVKALFADIKSSYGFIPNLFAFMAEAPTTIEAYLALNKLISRTSFNPAQQQVALLAASIENACEFCTIAHRAMGKMNKVNPQTLDALSSNSTIKDPEDQALASMTRTIVNKRGRLEQGDISAFVNAGFSKQQILELILIISIKTLSNYINHLTQPEANQELIDML